MIILACLIPGGRAAPERRAGRARAAMQGCTEIEYIRISVVSDFILELNVRGEILSFNPYLEPDRAYPIAS